MRTALFVQARLNSTRIPKKMFLSLHENKPIIYYSLQAVSEIIKHDERILLIPYGETEYFTHVAKQFDFRIIEGPEQDLLGRFIIGLNALPNIDAVIRGCADKILYDKFHQDIILKEHEKCNCALTHIIEDPIRSVTAEVYKVSSLYTVNLYYPWVEDTWIEDAWRKKREHIKPLFTDFWDINTIPVEDKFKSNPINFSIDTKEDLERMRNLFSDLYTGNALHFADVLRWFSKNGL